MVKNNKNKEDVSRSLSYYAWKRFKRNNLALMGMGVIIMSALIFILGYLITPDPTPDSNDQKPELQIKPPGFSIKMLKIRKNEESHDVNFLTRMVVGEQTNFSFISVYDYTFSGNDIVVEEYTGNEPNRGTKVRFNLADVVYDMNALKPIKNDELNGIMEFNVISSPERISKSTKDLQNEVEPPWLKK